MVSYDGKEKREKKRRRRSFTRFLFILVVLGYFAFRAVPIVFGIETKTVLPENDEVIDFKTVDSLIIKNEVYTRTETGGEVRRYYPDGSRVSSGSLIASLSTSANSEDLKKELTQIEESMETLKEMDLGESTSEVDIVEGLQTAIRNGELDKAYLYTAKLDGQNKIETDQTENQLSKLQNKYDNIHKEIDNNNFEYYAPIGGILSYKFDGEEDKFNISNIANIKFDDILPVDIDTKNLPERSLVGPSSGIYKIIDNFNWYLILKIENFSDFKDYEEGNIIRVRMDDGDIISGRITEIIKEGQKGVIKIKFTTKLHNYYDKRYMKVDIIKNVYNGLRIPTEAIIEENGQKGVLVKEYNGIVRFRPIKILLSEEERTIVSKGNHEFNIMIEDVELRTITIYDQVILNTNNIKIGQIID